MRLHFVSPSGNTTLTRRPVPLRVLSPVLRARPLCLRYDQLRQPIPTNCTTSSYYVSTAKAAPGAETPFPVAPNSFLFDLGGDKMYMGSDFGAEIITPAQFGTTNNPFTSIGTVTGNVLAVSSNGFAAAFSDTVHTPNQVYIVSTANATTPAIVPLDISSAAAAAFSPDSLKNWVVGGTGATSLYVYSSAQALQGPITLSGAGNAVAFSPNGGFAYHRRSGQWRGTANVTAYANCNNQVAATVPLPANPILMKVLPNVHMDGKDSYGNSIPDGVHVLVLDSTGLDIVTSTISPLRDRKSLPADYDLHQRRSPAARPEDRIGPGHSGGTYQNFFASADGSQLYVVNSSSSSIFIYNFLVGSVIGGIELLNNATPVMRRHGVDAGTILIAGSDGMLHEVTTSAAAAIRSNSPSQIFPTT